MHFTRPTVRGWVLMLGSAVWLLIALVNDKLLPCVFALGGVAMCASSFIAAMLSVRHLRVVRGAIGDASTGHAVSMPLLVVNTAGRRRQPVVIAEECKFTAERVTATVVSDLTAREERWIQRRILAMRRGEFELGSVILRGGDPAGLFRREAVFHLPQKLVVLPGTEVLPGLPLAPSEALTGVAGTPLSSAGTSQEVYAVREYHPTDGMRHIHWRSSARRGKLMVREFERNAVAAAAVVLDAYEPDVSSVEPWSNLEYQVRAAASVCRHISEMYCQLAFGAGGAEEILVSPALASEIEAEILYSLALLQPGPIPVSDVVLRLGERLMPGTVLFCFSLGARPALANALDVLALEGVTVHWLCASPEAFRTPMDAHRAHARADAASRSPAKGRVLTPVQLHPGLPLAGAIRHA